MNDNLLSYRESEGLLASLLSLPPPPLGTIGNPIIVSDNEDDIKNLLSHPSYHEARSMFTTPTLQLLHCQKTVLTDITITLNILNTSAIIA
jgi:hypothetical protein